MKRLLFILLLISFSFGSGSYGNRPFSIFSENLKYVLEVIPSEPLGDESIGIIYKMNGTSRGDSLWSISWTGRHYELTLTNSGDCVIECNRMGYGDAFRVQFRNEESWEFDYPDFRRREKRKHMTNAGINWFPYFSTIPTGLSNDNRKFTLIFSNGTGLVLDLIEKKVIDEFYTDVVNSSFGLDEYLIENGDSLFESLRLNDLHLSNFLNNYSEVTPYLTRYGGNTLYLKTQEAVGANNFRYYFSLKYDRFVTRYSPIVGWEKFKKHLDDLKELNLFATIDSSLVNITIITSTYPDIYKFPARYCDENRVFSELNRGEIDFDFINARELNPFIIIDIVGFDTRWFYEPRTKALYQAYTATGSVETINSSSDKWGNWEQFSIYSDTISDTIKAPYAQKWKEFQNDYFEVYPPDLIRPSVNPIDVIEYWGYPDSVIYDRTGSMYMAYKDTYIDRVYFADNYYPVFIRDFDN